MFQLIVYQRMGEEVIGIEIPKKLKNLCFLNLTPTKCSATYVRWPMGGRIVFPIASLSFFQFKILLKMLGYLC